MSSSSQPSWSDRWGARLLQTPWLARLPIPLYRAGLGWLLGRRIAMIEHLGRKSGQARYVVVEVMERTDDALFVASGLGTGSQWYQNLVANGVAYISTGRVRRVPAQARLLDADQSREVIERYARTHPAAWRRLKGIMDTAAAGSAQIAIVEFSLPGTAAEP